MAQRGTGSPWSSLIPSSRARGDSSPRHGRFELKLLIDMNLSPQWIEALVDAGVEARHGSEVCDGAASDREVWTTRPRGGPERYAPVRRD